MSGFWIELEGSDGCGTSTQAPLLAANLRSRGYTVIETHEPWETGPRGQLIRDILQHRVTELPAGSGSIDPTVFQWQFTFNRVNEHYPAVIEPALAAGQVVVSDRGRPSTYAYGSAFGVSTDMIDEWHKLLLPRKPDMILYLATTPETCMARLNRQERQGQPEYFERADKIARIIKHYELVLEQYFAEITIPIDNERYITKVEQVCLDAVLQRISL